jgi:hypothetical protein
MGVKVYSELKSSRHVTPYIEEHICEIKLDLPWLII